MSAALPTCSCVCVESDCVFNMFHLLVGPRFLFDNKSQDHVYYRWKLFSILQVFFCFTQAACSVLILGENTVIEGIPIMMSLSYLRLYIIRNQVPADLNLSYSVQSGFSPWYVSFLLPTGRVSNRVEDHRFPHVPGRLHMEAPCPKQLLSEWWTQGRDGGRRPLWGGEERAAQNWVRWAGTVIFLFAIQTSMELRALWLSRHYCLGTNRGWRLCSKSWHRAEKILPMPCCSVFSERMQQRK